MRKLLVPLALAAFASASCSHAPATPEVKPGADEKHFKSLKQLTFDGTNAEAYFSPDGKKLIFQGHTHEQGCDQMYTMNVDGSDKTLVSLNGGRNTCGYFIDDGKRVIFSSTYSSGRNCPPEHDKSKGYVWDIFKSYNIYSANLDGSNVRPVTVADGYDAESTVCGDKIVFTSAREGNTLNVFTMNTDGSGVKQLTKGIGYTGGPFFSADCTKIVYRATHPRGKKAIREFKKAIGEGYVPPGPLELYVMNADGSNQKQLTNYGASSFAPSFFPDGKRVIFSSNRNENGAGRVFQLWAIPASAASGDKAADALDVVTTEGTFNGFPMFSPDGKYLAFASNRNSANPHEVNVFLAEWQD